MRINNWNIFLKNIKKMSHLDLIISIFDLILFSIILFYIINHISYIILNLPVDIYSYINSLWSNNILVLMVNDPQGTVTTTTTQIMHSSEGWSSAIKSIFIYGAGGARLALLRNGGTPLQRTFVIVGTLAMDSGSAFVKNAINDPEYVEKNINSWRRIFKGSSDEVHFDVKGDSNLYKHIKTTDTNSLLPDNSNNLLPDFLNTEEVQHVMNFFIDNIKSVLEPITVTYSNQLLADQIYFISIVLFIMSLFVTGLILFLLLNIIVFTFSDKLLNMFTNKYIRWYINLNKKFIGIEISFMGLTILYGMIHLSYGLHFIATHPIIFS